MNAQHFYRSLPIHPPPPNCPEPSGKKIKMSPLPLRYPAVKGQEINCEKENITCATRLTNRQKNELGLISRTSHRCVKVTETLATWGPDKNGIVLWFSWRESVHIQALREITRPLLTPSPLVAVFILCDKNNLSCIRLEYLRCLFRHKQTTENWSKRLR